ncbi:hypothetical protein L3Q82_018690 [Scortum barcoo]|uniref:Uncharacterized protein n=1 Tax=Scortum barcoo TaxID=214431 RepID=A0ACB8VFC2_9TELE|nr:hypothetical protein L3Q82_018690 [Scortum barcoo]
MVERNTFEDLLNPTDLPSSEEAEAGDSEVDSSITQAEVTEVVRKLLGGKVPGVDEIRPEYLKSLDVVGLSWLTRLCNIAWRLGTVPLEWQTGVVVPLFKKGDRRVCSNLQRDHTSQPPREGLRQGTGEENSAYSRTSDSGGTMRFSSRSWNTGPALYPPQGAGGFMGVCPTSPHVLCGSGEGIRPCPSWYSLWECSMRVWGPGAFAKGCSVSVRPEQELGSHCRQTFSMCWERFAAECEAAGMRISTSKSEAMASRPEKGGVPSPGVSGEVLPQVEGVQVSRGLVHE